MGLRRLDGPTAVRNHDGKEIQLRGPGLWYDNVGIVSHVGGAMLLITLDGWAEPISSSFGHEEDLGWWVQNRRLLMVSRGTYIGYPEYPDLRQYIVEPTCFCFQFVPNGLVGPADRHWWTQFVRLQDDRHVFVGHVSTTSTISYWKDGEITDLGTVPYFARDVWVGRNDTEVFVWGAGGGKYQCNFFDTLTGQISSPIMYFPADGDTIWACNYVPQFGVIFTFHYKLYGPTKLSVWSLEVEPKTLANPTVIREQVKAGRVTTFQTRALGDQGEPCVGEYIDWELTGKGRLLTLQSKTDEQGYAIAKVLYNLADGGEWSVITANLRC